jgi:4-hydroxy 2-oxovalerate aldolase
LDNIKLLDCTLRDGMYVTGFRTSDAIKAPVVRALDSAGIDIIECGFLKRGAGGGDSAIYGSPAELAPYICPKKPGTLYAAIVMSFDEAPDFPERDRDGLDCIRIAFFKRDADEGLALAERVKSKGYDVLLQPMRTGDYSDGEIRALLGKANSLMPFGLAIVDSNGNMMPDEMARYANIYRECLDEGIYAGFHFHNNSQLAFANAIGAIDIMQGRRLVIDCSIFGMGRGAGNLPTELIAAYLNRHGGRYDVNAVFDTYELYLSETFKTTPWGYSQRHLVSAMRNANPYFATFMTEMYGLSARELDKALSSLSEDEKISFRPELAEKAIRGIGRS